MSGHSKWSTIKRKKGEKDGARAKIFTKVSREIIVCIRESGNPNPTTNGKLRALIAKAKQNSIPNDNIDRLLKKASSEKSDYKRKVYEGYGIGGVAVIVDCLTDNLNRTAGEVRHYFDKFGGNMGTSGCVSYLFTPKGIIILDNEDEKLDFDKVMEDVLETGGNDLNFEQDEDDGETVNTVKIETDPDVVSDVAEKLTGLGYTVLSSEVQEIPSTTAVLSEEQLVKFELMLDAMEDYDDVQNVWHNLES
ncbi:MAG: YebC/PmpR family DNA-binding transcriptional regulator [Oscillospiraceae bacterium]|jgi:YebC/PmpR family DNA-binding regulatory protein|nr:YebC/PmpR family DNA-binding transcriptional regulator [Oscillospiraceae bacterium]